MKIYLHEITDVDTDLEFTQDEKWVLETVERIDEKTELQTLSESLRPAQHAGATAGTPPRKIRVRFNLRQVDEVVVVNGDLETYIELVCSRCANSFHMNCSPHFSSLFCRDPDMAGIAHLAARPGADRKESGKPVGQNKGFARHAHDYGRDALDAQGKDLDITYLSGNYIDLADIFSEQLRLEIPFQPLCREDCKGICAHCGTDQNSGRCACAKLNKTGPFAALQNFKA